MQEAVESERSRTTSPLHQINSLTDHLVPVATSPDQDLLSPSASQPSVMQQPSNSLLFSGMSLEQKYDHKKYQEKQTCDALSIGSLAQTMSLDGNPEQLAQDGWPLYDNGSPSESKNCIINSLKTDGDKGPSQLVNARNEKETFLDALLDLSTTEHATLEPISSACDTNISSVHAHFNSVSTPSYNSEVSKLSSNNATPGNQQEVSTLPFINQTLNDDAKSRTSRADQLLSSIDPLAKSTSRNVTLADLRASTTTDSSANITISKSAEDIAKLYPQLSRTQLSGTSAMPLNLGRLPQTGGFAFVETQEEKKEKRTKVGQEDAFGFVHDAMAKAGKR